MLVRLTMPIVLAVLFVAPVFGQDDLPEILEDVVNEIRGGLVSEIGEESFAEMRGELFRDSESTHVDRFGNVLLAFSDSGTGLEVSDYRNVEVIIADVPTALTENGLTKERIRTRVELRLRGTNLTPVNLSSDGHLYVLVNGVGEAFSTTVAYRRRAYYLVDDPGSSPIEFKVFGRLVEAWNTGSVGQTSANATFILDNLDERLDIFLDEYLAANQP